MPGNPRLKRHISIVAHDLNRVELRSGGWNVTSIELSDEKGTGKLFDLLSLLDGSASAGDVASKAGVARSEVEALIDHLVQLDMVEFGPSSAVDYYLDTIVWPLRRVDSDRPPMRDVVLLGERELTGRLANALNEVAADATLQVIGPTDPGGEVLYGADGQWRFDALALEQVAQRLSHLAGKFVIHVDRSLQPMRLTHINALALHLGFDWIQACVDGPQLLVGPLFEANRTACYECLEARVLMNMRDAGNYVAYKASLARSASHGAPNPSLRLLDNLAVDHLALEAANALLTGTTFTRGKLLTMYLPTMEIIYHEVLRLPGCAACSPSAAANESELYFDGSILAAQ